MHSPDLKRARASAGTDAVEPDRSCMAGRTVPKAFTWRQTKRVSDVARFTENLMLQHEAGGVCARQTARQLLRVCNACTRDSFERDLRDLMQNEKVTHFIEANIVAAGELACWIMTHVPHECEPLSNRGRYLGVRVAMCRALGGDAQARDEHGANFLHTLNVYDSVMHCKASDAEFHALMGFVAVQLQRAGDADIPQLALAVKRLLKRALHLDEGIIDSYTLLVLLARKTVVAVHKAVQCSETALFSVDILAPCMQILVHEPGGVVFPEVLELPDTLKSLDFSEFTKRDVDLSTQIELPNQVVCDLAFCSLVPNGVRAKCMNYMTRNRNPKVRPEPLVALLQHLVFEERGTDFDVELLRKHAFLLLCAQLNFHETWRDFFYLARPMLIHMACEGVSREDVKLAVVNVAQHGFSAFEQINECVYLRGALEDALVYGCVPWRRPLHVLNEACKAGPYANTHVAVIEMFARVHAAIETGWQSNDLDIQMPAEYEAGPQANDPDTRKNKQMYTEYEACGILSMIARVADGPYPYAVAPALAAIFSDAACSCFVNNSRFGGVMTQILKRTDLLQDVDGAKRLVDLVVNNASTRLHDEELPSVMYAAFLDAYPEEARRVLELMVGMIREEGRAASVITYTTVLCEIMEQCDWQSLDDHAAIIADLVQDDAVCIWGRSESDSEVRLWRSNDRTGGLRERALVRMLKGLVYARPALVLCRKDLVSAITNAFQSIRVGLDVWRALSKVDAENVTNEPVPVFDPEFTRQMFQCSRPLFQALLYAHTEEVRRAVRNLRVGDARRGLPKWCLVVAIDEDDVAPHRATKTINRNRALLRRLDCVEALAVHSYRTNKRMPADVLRVFGSMLM